MKTRKVKIHDREWFEENCMSDGELFTYHENINGLLLSDHEIIGKTVDLIYSADLQEYIIRSSRAMGVTIVIEGWMIEKEITETDDFFDNFISYIKDTTKSQLMEEWSKYEKWDEVGPTIKEFMENLNK
ncbi:MAG: hypothetical protein ACRDD8_04920 [Bacteroidales bacterium]